jgi:hypothetical protein
MWSAAASVFRHAFNFSFPAHIHLSLVLVIKYVVIAVISEDNQTPYRHTTDQTPWPKLAHLTLPAVKNIGVSLAGPRHLGSRLPGDCVAIVSNKQDVRLA